MTVPDADPGPSDADLIAAWSRGDEGAAAVLVRRHARALARFLGAAGARDDVDDLVQETFYRAFRRIDGFRGGSSFRTWLLTIGRNALKDANRRARRRPVIPLDDREVAVDAEAPHHETVARDVEARLADEVAKLPPMQRDVFLMRAQQGLGYEAIAETLETSVGAARVHYHHAVKRLKEALERCA